MDFEILSKDKNVFKKDNMVIKPLERWSSNIHSFLSFLYQNNLPVQKLIKIDDKNEYFEYIEGEQIHPYRWTNESLNDIGDFIKRLHNIEKKFDYNEKMEWKPWYLREIGTPNIISHGDIAPWNVITKDGKLIGLIDWEYTGPIDPLIELARICWLFPQLHDDDIGKKYNLPSPKIRGKQVKIILDAYGLEKEKRRDFIEKIMEVIICETAHEAIDNNVTMETIGNLWGMGWRNRSLYWILRNRKELEKEIIS